MTNYCAFSKGHRDVLWDAYQVTRGEIEEVNQMCHGNWIEIQKQWYYIYLLRSLLDEHNIPWPEFD